MANIRENNQNAAFILGFQKENYTDLIKYD